MGINANSTVTGAPPSGDQANAVVTGALTSTTTTPFFSFFGPFNVTLWGTFSATTVLERSFDGGTTWIVRSDAPSSGSYTTATSFAILEPEQGVQYRLNCTFVSGTVNYRMSATGPAAKTFGMSAH